MMAVEKRILVVDDEEIVRESCRRALTEAGYSVRTVGSGRDALEACRAERFDVMFTDLKMPDMDGLSVIRAVTSEFPDVRVVVITGYPSRETADQAEQLGTFGYLAKPVSAGNLSEATAAALASAPRRAAGTVPAKAAPAAQSEAARETVGLPAGAERAVPQTGVRLMAVVSAGFLVGVAVAYLLAPSQALAYLAVGSAIAAGTILGLFSDAIFARGAPPRRQDPTEPVQTGRNASQPAS